MQDLLRSAARLGGLALSLIAPSCQPNRPPSAAPRTDLVRELTIPATAYPRRYNENPGRAQGHHLIVWSGGRQAGKALLESDTADGAFLETLLAMGARAGNNLSERTWTANGDPDAPEPDQHVMGSPVRISVRWDSQTHPLESLLTSSAPLELDIRVGGHADLIPVFRSGCITCAFSCPGGRTSNAAVTIRDQVSKRQEFRANLEAWPPDGTPVEIVFELMNR